MSLAEELLQRLRDPGVPSAAFRKIACELAQVLATNALLSPFTPTTLVPILRSGIALLPPFSAAFPDASIGILGIKRDERTAEAHMYYNKLPHINRESRILVLDPMIATGNTARLAIKTLTQRGAVEKGIALIGVIASEQGRAAVKRAFPDVALTVVATDPALTADFMISPGLGDFGDRFFNT